MQLKHYQQTALDALGGYFQTCVQVNSPNVAFYRYTLERYGTGVPYTEAPGLPGPPYVCLRIPTGGGKTLVASHAVGVAARELLQADQVVALWLVPSNIICDQTIQALKAQRHPYRQALEAVFGAVTVLSVGEALAVQPATLATSTVVIVSTIQAFRVDDTEGRKVYEAAGALMSHLTPLPAASATLAMLEKRKDGSVIPSLANVLCLHQPIVIVDEAHNARTPLSFETLSRFNPACVLEFTATPSDKDSPSNVLHSVSAAELHAEDMVKLPIRLETSPEWKSLLADAIAQRDMLEQLAGTEQSQTGEYLRPIMLLQAEKTYKGKETVNVDVLRDCLLQDFRIPEAQIARATGDYAELENIDLTDPACAIRYIITVQQLREGWDCPFAYVLCSMAEMVSSTAVEQILGRIMRLPQVRRKQQDELNKAYAFAASNNFSIVAKALTDALIQNGFERHEVAAYIEKAPKLPQFTGPLFEALAADAASFVVHAEPALNRLPAQTAAKVTYDPNTHTVIFKGLMQEHDREALKQVCTTASDQDAVEQAYHSLQGKSLATDVDISAQRDNLFSVPLLAIQQGSLFEPLEQTHIMSLGWQLSHCDPVLSEAEFPSVRPTGQVGEVTFDAADGRIRSYSLDALHQQMTLLAADHGWTEAMLVTWLDRTLPNRADITQPEARAFLVALVCHLLDARSLTLDQLVHDKYRLRTAIIEKIARHRETAYRVNLNRLFALEATAPITVTPEVAFVFDSERYHYTRPYTGAYRFRKHYYDIVGNLGAEGEEFECAVHLDTHLKVAKWVRNPEREPNAFWLPTSTGRFYPDFVCQLTDGRLLVVEYKGKHLWDKPSEREKRLVGEVWEQQSNGTCVFVMLTERQFGEIDAKL